MYFVFLLYLLSNSKLKNICNWLGLVSFVPGKLWFNCILELLWHGETVQDPLIRLQVQLDHIFNIVEPVAILRIELEKSRESCHLTDFSSCDLTEKLTRLLRFLRFCCDLTEKLSRLLRFLQFEKFLIARSIQAENRGFLTRVWKYAIFRLKWVLNRIN